MSEEDKGFAESVEVQVNAVSIKTSNSNSGEVSKIIFETNKGNITWKPKIEKIEHRNGLKIIKKVPCLIDDLPKKVTDIATIATNDGKCTVIVCYNWWKTENDGQPVTYRFLLSETTLDKWKVIVEKSAEEKVV